LLLNTSFIALPRPLPCITQHICPPHPCPSPLTQAFIREENRRKAAEAEARKKRREETAARKKQAAETRKAEEPPAPAVRAPEPAPPAAAPAPAEPAAGTDSDADGAAQQPATAAAKAQKQPKLQQRRPKGAAIVKAPPVTLKRPAREESAWHKALRSVGLESETNQAVALCLAVLLFVIVLWLSTGSAAGRTPVAA
jgi:cobalamin biosynthesis Mg chelatase CobN